MDHHEETLFPSPAAKAEAVLQFENLAQHRGWQYVVKIIELNIQVCEKKLLQGSGENETKETIQALRDKILCYKELINTPQFMMKVLTEEEQGIESDDPY